jgi:ABC-type multidrug transport system fused ATPase/permease subunit
LLPHLWLGISFHTGTRCNYNVRVKLHRALLRQEAAFFDSTETGELISRINNDVNKIGMVVSFHVNVVLRQSVQFFIGSAFLIKISPMLSFYAFVGIALVAYVSKVYGDFARRTAVVFQDILAHASAVAETSFSMSETVRAFNGLPVESAKYEDAQLRALNMDETQAWAYGTHKFVSDTLQYALQVALLFSCWVLGRAGRIPSVQLTQFLVYANFVLESSNEVGDQFARIQTAIGASSSVFELIRRVPSIRDPDVHSTISHNVTNATSKKSLSTEPIPLVSLENLTLIYDGFELPALEDINLDIHAGDRVAIVGEAISSLLSQVNFAAMLRFF